MAQHGGSTTATDAANRSTTTTAANGNQALQGANAELLLNMMNCVDTSLFSPQQLNNWEQMKQRIKTAAEQNIPLVVPAKIMDLTKSHQPAVVATSAVASNGETDDSSSAIDYRTPLHREASIQDVLSCLLDQQAPSLRMMASSGSNVLVNSEMKNKSSNDEHRPTLKSLLSSNDFTMTEKKQSLNHLLSFIDSSFASHPEPMTDVYKESQDGNLRRLSSLHLMRSFLVPNTNAQSMGRTTSFEIIQSMLNATSNHTIQKPMTSQDSFRFQHLANVLESIEGDVGYDNEDYGGEEVVQVDNLDNLLDYQSPTHASQGTTGGFVNTQTMVNQSSRLGGFHNDYASAAQGGNGYQSYQQQMYAAQYGHQPELGMLGGNTGMMYSDTLVKEEPAPQMMNTGMMQQQQQQYNPMSFQSAMMAATPGLTLLTPQAQNTSYQQPQATNNNMIKANTLQHQQYSAMLMQQQQQHMQQQQQQVASGLHQSAAAHSKAHKQDSTNGVQICSALGCNHAARVKGMCKLHGGGRRCKVEGCMKSAQTGHLCIAHGGGKPCHVEGCPKTAQSRGLCKQHGGGVRCKFEGCTKSCQSGGYCRGHGGGKRCEFPNCTKWAQKNGHCAKHAQEVTQHIP